MARVEGSEKYKGYVKYIATAIIASFLVLFTPHTLIVTPQELKALDGMSHPYLSLLGAMPAKLTAINIIIVGTYLSLMIYRRSNRVPIVSWARYGNAAIASILLVGVVNIITLGVSSYLVPTTMKIGHAIPQVFTTLSIIILSIVIESFLFKGAKPLGPIQWGKMPPRSQYALFLFAISFTWLMSLMGYLRSAIRQHWHVYTVMRDNSRDAFTPTIGYATDMTTIITIIFLTMVVFIFWLNQMSSKKGLKV
jgi:cytochrome d ubiquinol oxidase subunit I